MPRGITALPRGYFGGVQIQSDDLHPTLRDAYVRSVDVSFETGEQTTHFLYFPQPVTITGYRAQVTKALAATDSGTIQFKDNDGNNITANGLITLPASTAIGTEVNGSGAFTTNNRIPGGGKLQLVAAKTTAGGKVRLGIEYRPT